ncbi:MAG TPA: cytochrome c biogenesis protein CcdA [Candidatus Acidoferrales bacterium]|jgi:cytochrome c-type biogenesis protein|nr:cytochrome c biogenesis protein CcdA [Candidatus Acidoferrales bacterium]
MPGAELVLAFLAGIVSFASPCCLPLVPAYVGYMVGAAPEGLAERERRVIAFRQSLAFVAGFSAVFIALWASVGMVGYLLRDQAWLLREIGGAAIVFMGLHVAGVINIGALSREVRLPVGPMAGTTGAVAFGAAAPSAPGYGRSALLGVTFAAGWTPCIGPILGGIIGLASVGSSVLAGTALLVAYATGLAVPFVLVAVGASSISDRLGWLRDHHRLVSIVTGAMLVAVGFLMITNSFARLSRLVPSFGL